MLVPQYEEICQFVIASQVIGADETGANVNGKNHWAWVFQNVLATFFCLHKSRGIKAIHEIMLEGFVYTTLVTDCWSAYFKEPDVEHQLCFAHLMRDLIYMGQLYPKNNNYHTFDNRWPMKFQRLASDNSINFSFVLTFEKCSKSIISILLLFS